MTKITFDVEDVYNLDFDTSLIDAKRRFQNMKLDKSKLLRAIFVGVSKKRFTVSDLIRWFDEQGVTFES